MNVIPTQQFAYKLQTTQAPLKVKLSVHFAIHDTAVEECTEAETRHISRDQLLSLFAVPKGSTGTFMSLYPIRYRFK